MKSELKKTLQSCAEYHSEIAKLAKEEREYREQNNIGPPLSPHREKVHRRFSAACLKASFFAIIGLLALAPVTRKGAMVLMDLAKSSPRTSVNVRTVAPSSPMLPQMNANRVTRAGVQPRVGRTNILPFILAPDPSNHWWRAVRTTNLHDWVAVGPVYYGPQSTNSDITITNNLSLEFWRLHRVDLP